MNAPIYLALLGALLAAGVPVLKARVVDLVLRSAQAVQAPPPGPRPHLAAALSEPHRPGRRPAHCR